MSALSERAAVPAPVVAVDRVDSTNAEALRRAGAGERGPLWITAREQSAGRGRRGRTWTSPPGNLHATLLLNDAAPAAVAPQLGFVAGLAVHDAAVALVPRLAGRLALKWPNDLLCGGAKLAGILIEGEGSPLTVAVGIGVNCRHHPSGLPYPTTDLAAEGADVDPAVLLSALTAAMAARLAQWRRGAGFAAIRAAWLERAQGVGGAIAVHRDGAAAATGRFETIDDGGRLVLRTADGVTTVAAGDVFPLDVAPFVVAEGRQ